MINKLKNKNYQNGIIPASAYSDCYKQPFAAAYGNLSNLITSDLIDACINANYIIIYGHTKSGKSVLTKELSKKLNNRKYIYSDWYKKYGFKRNMYHILRIILENEKKEIPDKLIIEGIQMSRLLRKGIQLKNFNPDVVIHIVCNFKTIRYAYIRAGEGHKLRGNGRLIIYWNNMIDKIFSRWWDALILSGMGKPVIIKIDTSIF